MYLSIRGHTAALFNYNSQKVRKNLSFSCFYFEDRETTNNFVLKPLEEKTKFPFEI